MSKKKYLQSRISNKKKQIWHYIKNNEKNKKIKLQSIAYILEVGSFRNIILYAIQYYFIQGSVYYIS